MASFFVFTVIIFIFPTLWLKDGHIFHRVIHHHDDREATFCAAMRMLPQGSHHGKWRSQIANWKEDEKLDNVTNGCMFSNLPTLKKWLTIKMTLRDEILRYKPFERLTLKWRYVKNMDVPKGTTDEKLVISLFYKSFDVLWTDSY